MKVLVFSDSHGRVSEMENAVYRHTPDYLIHLGDYAADASALHEIFPRIPLSTVKGNCDFHSDEPTEVVLTLGGAKLFVTHGHRYGVKMELLRLFYATRECGAQVALFGHTHFQTFLEEDGLMLINPGSIHDAAEYALLEIENGNVRCLLQHE